MRLDRFLAQYLKMGRREIRPILAAQRVRVNGVIETNQQREINTFTRVELDHSVLQDKQAVYLMLHKPAGYLSATSDASHPTVMELIDSPETLHIAGRLDRATTGLLLLTNDGQWSRKLTNPATKKNRGVPKTYRVTTSLPISPESIDFFQKGIFFPYENITTSPAKLNILTPHTCLLTIYEGKYHQVKRMFHAVGNRVTALHRTQVGNIKLDATLAPGESRALNTQEIADINNFNSFHDKSRNH